jgi:quercetin dioxygenase-like cupin family protein
VRVEIRNLQDLVRFDDEAPTRKTLHDTANLWSELVCINRNQSYGPVGDDGAESLFTVVAGEAVFQVDGRRKRLRQWRTLLAEPGRAVTVTNASSEPLVLLVVLAPPPVTTADAAPGRPDRND